MSNCQIFVFYFLFYRKSKKHETLNIKFGMSIFGKCPLKTVDYEERKLSKLKNSSNILEQLKARREHCIENLLVGNINLNDRPDVDEILHLNEDIESNRGRDLLRYIQPEQPINLGELVTIIHHDQLEQDHNNSTNDEEANTQ